MKANVKQKWIYIKLILLIIIIFCATLLFPHNIITGISVDIEDPARGTFEIFYYIHDTDYGSVRLDNVENGITRRNTQINLEDMEIIRIDPTDDYSRVKIRSISFNYLFMEVYKINSIDIVGTFTPLNDIKEFCLDNDHAVITSVGEDPILIMDEVTFDAVYEKLDKNMFNVVWLLRGLFVFTAGIFILFVQKFLNIIKLLFYKVYELLNNADCLMRLKGLLSKANRMMEKVYKRYLRKVWFMIFLLLIVGGCAFLYYQYLTGNKLFLFPTLNSDAYVQFYPMYYMQNEHFHEYGNVFGYSFKNGLGGEVSTLNPFILLYTISNIQWLPYLLSLVQVLKIVAAGIFFILFLREHKMSVLTCVAGGLCYAFCVQIVMGGLWASQAETGIILAMLLYSVERIIGKRKFGWILISLIILYLSVSKNYQIVIAAIVFLYCFMRIILKTKGNLKSLLKKVPVWAWGVIAVLVCIGGSVVINQLITLFSNKEIHNNLEQIRQVPSVFSRENIEMVKVMFLRTVSHVVLGIVGDSAYYGIAENFGDGTFYCGIICLILYPQIFVKSNKKEKILWGCWSALLLLISCVPKVRFFLQGGSNYYFKNVRLLGTILICYPAMLSLNNIFCRKKKLNIKVLLGTVVAIMAAFNISGIIYIYNERNLSLYNIIIADFLILLYTLILIISQKKLCMERNGFVLGSVLIFTVFIEMMCMNYDFVNVSDALSKDEFADCYINDGTKEVSQKIKMSEGNTFYRTNKSYDYWYSDAGAQGYNGTTYYSGTLTTTTNAFLDLVYQIGLPTHGNRPGYFAGTYGYPYASAILSCKYGLAKESSYIDYGYRYKWNDGETDIYENDYFLPMGFMYNYAIAQSDYEEMGIRDKMSALLAGAVLEDEVFAAFNMSEPDEKDYINNVQPLTSKEYHDLGLNEELEISIDNPDNTLEIYINAKGIEQGVKIFWRSEDEEYEEERSRLISLYENGAGEALMTISNQKDIDYIRINSFPEKESSNIIPYIQLNIYDSDKYYEKYRNNIRNLGKRGLELQEMTDEYINGSIDAEHSGICYFPILFNAPFRYYVDGVEVEPLKVNYGFNGIYLTEGHHTIEIKYVSTSPIYKLLKGIR